jgi:P-type E1-E2 ATPase
LSAKTGAEFERPSLEAGETRLSAVDEAATMDVLCVDKTGTLTRNALTVTTVRPMDGFDEAHALALVALASSDGRQDPVDRAIRCAEDNQVRFGDEDVRSEVLWPSH